MINDRSPPASSNAYLGGFLAANCVSGGQGAGGGYDAGGCFGFALLRGFLRAGGAPASTFIADIASVATCITRRVI